MMSLLDGQTAIITGGGQGIGLAIVEAALTHGAQVMVADIDQQKADEAIAPFVAKGLPVYSKACDVRSQDDLEALVEITIERFGGVDALVNNAGVTRDGYIAKLTEQDYDIVVDISVKGAWLGTRAVAPIFREQRSGSVVNISSLSGKIGNPGQTNYSAAKAALVGLTKATAKEFGDFGARANAVQPGLIRTTMTESMKPEIWASKEAEVPLKRAGEVSEVADAVVFLNSYMASYINGAVLEVTGGRGI